MGLFKRIITAATFLFVCYSVSNSYGPFIGTASGFLCWFILLLIHPATKESKI